MPEAYIIDGVRTPVGKAPNGTLLRQTDRIFADGFE